MNEIQNIINLKDIMKFTHILSLFLGIALGMIVLEHGAKVYQLKYRPSVGLTYLGDKAIILFTDIGKIFAKISSFYTWVNLEDLWQTLQELFVPLIRLLSSPFYTIVGYMSIMVEYKYPMLIGLGSCTLINMLLFIKGKV